MYGNIMKGLACLTVAGLFFGGCKKETPEKPSTPAQAPAPAAGSPKEAQTGEALFMQHCAACHADGGNTINPKKTLHRSNREENGIKTAEDIIRTMRDPGPGMNRFDETTIPDRDARAIAEYVLKTFN